jgi:hypothetical protein
MRYPRSEGNLVSDRRSGRLLHREGGFGRRRRGLYVFGRTVYDEQGFQLVGVSSGRSHHLLVEDG